MLPRVVTPIIQCVKREPSLDLSGCLSTLKELSVYHKTNGANPLEIDGSIIDEIVDTLQCFKKNSSLCVTTTSEKSQVVTDDSISNVKDEQIESSNKNQEKEEDKTDKEEENNVNLDSTSEEGASQCDNPIKDDISIILSQTCSEPMEYIIGPKLIASSVVESEQLSPKENDANLNETSQ